MNQKLRAILCLLLCFATVLSFAACRQEEAIEPTGEKTTYTVQVVNEAGTGIADVGVYVYEDSTKAELVWYQATDANGQISFTDVQRSTYVAVLEGVPTGYAVEEYYALTDLATVITLSAGTMTGEEEITFQLGDMMMDFAFTATDGMEYTFKDLLKHKQAVVLNFYYNGCQPCRMEFPYLQEAYEEYAHQVAVIAMNPVDDVEAVAAFQKELELSFLMTSVNENWQNIMGITAYPTTVVIDRFGNIVLMHTGSIDSAQMFRDVFAAVTGDDYQQKIYQNITEIETTAQVGTAENPDFMGATPKFDITIPARGEYHIEFLKLNNLTMQVKDPDTYVIYQGQKYTPKNGVISLLVNCPDMNTSVIIVFGNNSDAEKTITVTMTAQPGSLDNPFTLKEGETTVKIAAGNEQGVYYIWTAPENGTLRSTCISATAGVNYDCTLYNLTSYAQRGISNEGAVDENGNKYVEVKVNKGDKVQLIAAVLPDSSWNYAAGTFVYDVQFTQGAGRDEDKEDLTVYTVTVTDQEAQPIANVNFHTVVKEEATIFVTKADGIATAELPTDTYQITMIVPDGYTTEVTEFTLTPEEPNYTLQLQTKVVVMVDYVVVVTNPEGEPIEGATVIIGEQFATTDAQGKVTLNLEQGEYTVSVSAPEGYVIDQDSYSFPEGQTQLTVTAAYVPGSQKNPIDLTEDLLFAGDFRAEVTVPAGKTLYYCAYRIAGMLMSIDGAEPALCTEGSVSVPFTFILSNVEQADRTIVITLAYPEGNSMNPAVLDELGQLKTQLDEGDDDGFYYRWSAQEEGVVTFYVAAAPEGVVCDISLTNQTNSVNRTLLADGQGGLVSLNVSQGDRVTIQIMTTGYDANGQYVGYPPVQIDSVGSFTAQENTEDTKLVYSVIVKDGAGYPMEGVCVSIGTAQLVTDANGMAFAQLVEGTYTAVVTAPEDYYLTNNQFTLTADAPQVTAILEAVIFVDYQVNLTYNGSAYTGQVTVQLLESGVLVQEQVVTNGKLQTTLPMGSYTVKLHIADTAMTYDPEGCKLTMDNPTLHIALQQIVKEQTYTITVVDDKNVPQAGVLVQIQKAGATVSGGTGTTNAGGVFTAKLPADNYTVNLSFSGKSCYYNKGTAVLSAANTELTIMLASEVDDQDVTPHWYIEDQNMYNLHEGYTHIKVGASYAYNKNVSGKNICFFVYNPDRPGSFRFVLDNQDVELMYYSTTNWPGFFSSSFDSDSRDIYCNIYEGQEGMFGLVIGVAVTNGITDLGITITRVGEPGFNPNYAPFDEAWMENAIAPTKFTLPAGALTYVDIYEVDSSKYVAVYNEQDGCYHLGSADGPLLYINLGKVTKPNGYSVNAQINGETIDGITLGGGVFMKYFYDEDGTFIKKEKYNDLMNEYIACADTKTGVYPATKDLVYMIQNGCESQWSQEGGLLLTANKDLAWMFGVCYIQ